MDGRPAVLNRPFLYRRIHFACSEGEWGLVPGCMGEQKVC